MTDKILKLWTHPTTGAQRIYVNHTSIPYGEKIWIICLDEKDDVFDVHGTHGISGPSIINRGLSEAEEILETIITNDLKLDYSRMGYSDFVSLAEE